MSTENITFRIGLLATGNELTEGDILNTNGQVIAQTLTEQGISIGLHVITSDAEQDIENALHFLLQSHDTVIITGGLGPTSDDRTRYALSTVINKKLILDENTWQAISARLQKFGFAVHPDNRQQALFPEDAVIIPNNNGTAAGCCVTHAHKTIYMLPGPPGECLAMFHEHVLPTLLLNQKQAGKNKLVWRLLGVVESEIAAQIDALVKSYPVTTGYRVVYPYIDIKIYSEQHAQYNEMLTRITTLVTPHLVSNTAQSASELLIELIKRFSGVISIQDDATGGHLQAALTTPETFKKLYFVDNNKHSSDLHIVITGLTEFWQQQPPNGKTSITLQFFVNQQKTERTVTLPYRNQNVVNYAAEYAALEIFRFLSASSFLL